MCQLGYLYNREPVLECLKRKLLDDIPIPPPAAHITSLKACSSESTSKHTACRIRRRKKAPYSSAQHSALQPSALLPSAQAGAQAAPAKLPQRNLDPLLLP